jgi:ubiquinone/menaquinone biosynthesis C-methylase UbiE
MGRGKVFPAARARSLISPLRRLVQSPQKTVAAMRLAPDARVLEIGSGPGFFSPSIADAVPDGRLVLLDLQGHMLRLASRRVGHCAHLVQADAARLPFANAAFDAVLIATVLGEIKDPDGCVDEVRRVMPPGGVASFAETRRDSDYLRLDQLTRLVERHSFEFLDQRGPSWQYLARYRAT